MINSKPRVVVTMGDPAGIGPEVVVKSLAKPATTDLADIVVVGDKGILEKAKQIAGSDITINVVDDPEDGNYEPGTLNLIDLANVDMDSFEYGKVQAQCGQAAYDYIKKAHELCLEGRVDAMATTTINKAALKATGIKTLGHTDILKELNQVDEDPLTMFQCHNLRTTFYSKHVSLRRACDLITKEGIRDYVIRTDKALRQLGIEHPRIAVAGLNPHCGEHGLFGEEEVKYIIPAVKELQQEGNIDVSGPIGADSVFFQAIEGQYDGVLSLYHDQGHIATKTYDHDRTISLTFGLPYLRTSVDHGTAFDIAGKGTASEVSLDEAIRLAALYAPRFAPEHKI